jgi:transketolase
MVQEAAAAAEALARDGISATVLDVHTLKPFPDDRLANLAAEHSLVVSIEEHNVYGGLGSMVVESIASRGGSVPTYKHGFQDEYSIIGAPTHLYAYYGLDMAGLSLVTKRALDLVASGRFFQRDFSTPLWTVEDRRRTAETIRERSARATEVPSPATT